MTKRCKVNKKKPDEHVTNGPFEFARFGKSIVGQSHTTTKQFNEMQQAMLKRLPVLKSEIDALVIKIAERVAHLPPDKLLQRSWQEYAAIVIQEKDDFERTHAMRMIDYVQSVITSFPPNTPYAEEVSEVEWKNLSDDIRLLFGERLLEYQICVTADNRTTPNFDINNEQFRISLENQWVNIRGKRYQLHEQQALLEILTPHSDILLQTFGIDALSIVEEFNKILAKFTYGYCDAFIELEKLNTIMNEELSLLPSMAHLSDTEIEELLIDKFYKDPDFAERYNKAYSVIFEFELFDVEENTKLPQALLHELAWSPGEEQNFFSPGPFRGWPLRIWPTMKRPFIKLNNRTLCFDIGALFDNFYRVIQRILLRLVPDYKTKWNDLQKAVSEELPFVYFKRLLPLACTYQSVYYRWKVNNKNQWCETDGLLIYDDHLFVIEIKAGAFTYTSPATDLESHITSLQTLIQKPAEQGNRFIDFLESASEVSIANYKHEEIGRLRRANFRRITLCTITLDPFTELAARVQHIDSIDIGQRPVWALSIDDLRVYADIFKNPLIFLHFVEQRMRAQSVELNDEMEHLGLYIAQNDYNEYVAQVIDGKKYTSIFINGHKEIIDEYYHAALASREEVILPKQKIPTKLMDVINYLSESSKIGRSEIANFLLNTVENERETIANMIDWQLQKLAPSHKGSQPTSIYIKDNGLTISCFKSCPAHHKTTITKNALQHARSLVAAHKKKTHQLIELEYSIENILLNVEWQFVNLKNLSPSEIALTHQDGLILRQRLIIAARKEHKIGVNELCPCGSALKYKRCCIKLC